MSVDAAFTKENLNKRLSELAKEFRRLNGTKMPAEVILVGGAAVIASYGFREKTYDVDAVIMASSAMKDAINRVGDNNGLPYGWFNEDFKKTKSYSERLAEVSVYYKTFSNILTVRTITAEYLVAMKLMSGRSYKYDKSDIIGILREQEKKGFPLTFEDVDRAMTKLYGGWNETPDRSKEWFCEVLNGKASYESLYEQIRQDEAEAKNLLRGNDKESIGKLREDNIDSVIEQIRIAHVRAGADRSEVSEQPSLEREPNTYR